MATDTPMAPSPCSVEAEIFSAATETRKTNKDICSVISDLQSLLVSCKQQLETLPQETKAEDYNPIVQKFAERVKGQEAHAKVAGKYKGYYVHLVKLGRTLDKEYEGNLSVLWRPIPLDERLVARLVSQHLLQRGLFDLYGLFVEEANSVPLSYPHFDPSSMSVQIKHTRLRLQQQQQQEQQQSPVSPKSKKAGAGGLLLTTPAVPAVSPQSPAGGTGLSTPLRGPGVSDSTQPQQQQRGLHVHCSPHSVTLSSLLPTPMATGGRNRLASVRSTTRTDRGAFGGLDVMFSDDTQTRPPYLHGELDPDVVIKYLLLQNLCADIIEGRVGEAVHLLESRGSKETERGRASLLSPAAPSTSQKGTAGGGEGSWNHDEKRQAALTFKLHELKFLRLLSRTEEERGEMVSDEEEGEGGTHKSPEMAALQYARSHFLPFFPFMHSRIATLMARLALDPPRGGRKLKRKSGGSPSPGGSADGVHNGQAQSEIGGPSEGVDGDGVRDDAERRKALHKVAADWIEALSASAVRFSDGYRRVTERRCPSPLPFSSYLSVMRRVGRKGRDRKEGEGSTQRCKKAKTAAATETGAEERANGNAQDPSQQRPRGLQGLPGMRARIEAQLGQRRDSGTGPSSSSSSFALNIHAPPFRPGAAAHPLRAREGRVRSQTRSLWGRNRPQGDTELHWGREIPGQRERDRRARFDTDDSSVNLRRWLGPRRRQQGEGWGRMEREWERAGVGDAPLDSEDRLGNLQRGQRGFGAYRCISPFLLDRQLPPSLAAEAPADRLFASNTAAFRDHRPLDSWSYQNSNHQSLLVTSSLSLVAGPLGPQPPRFGPPRSFRLTGRPSLPPVSDVAAAAPALPSASVSVSGVAVGTAPEDEDDVQVEDEEEGQGEGAEGRPSAAASASGSRPGSGGGRDSGGLRSLAASRSIEGPEQEHIRTIFLAQMLRRQAAGVTRQQAPQSGSRQNVVVMSSEDDSTPAAGPRRGGDTQPHPAHLRHHAQHPSTRVAVRHHHQQQRGTGGEPYSPWMGPPGGGVTGSSRGMGDSPLPGTEEDIDEDEEDADEDEEEDGDGDEEEGSPTGGGEEEMEEEEEATEDAGEESASSPVAPLFPPLRIVNTSLTGGLLQETAGPSALPEMSAQSPPALMMPGPSMTSTSGAGVQMGTQEPAQGTRGSAGDGAAGSSGQVIEGEDVVMSSEGGQVGGGGGEAVPVPGGGGGGGAVSQPDGYGWGGVESQAAPSPDGAPSAAAGERGGDRDEPMEPSAPSAGGAGGRGVRGGEEEIDYGSHPEWLESDLILDDEDISEEMGEEEEEEEEEDDGYDSASSVFVPGDDGWDRFVGRSRSPPPLSRPRGGGSAVRSPGLGKTTGVGKGVGGTIPSSSSASSAAPAPGSAQRRGLPEAGSGGGRARAPPSGPLGASPSPFRPPPSPTGAAPVPDSSAAPLGAQTPQRNPPLGSSSTPTVTVIEWPEGDVNMRPIGGGPMGFFERLFTGTDPPSASETPNRRGVGEGGRGGGGDKYSWGDGGGGEGWGGGGGDPEDDNGDGLGDGAGISEECDAFSIPRESFITTLTAASLRSIPKLMQFLTLLRATDAKVSAAAAADDEGGDDGDGGGLQRRDGGTPPQRDRRGGGGRTGAIQQQLTNLRFGSEGRGPRGGRGGGGSGWGGSPGPRGPRGREVGRQGRGGGQGDVVADLLHPPRPSDPASAPSLPQFPLHMSAIPFYDMRSASERQRFREASGREGEAPGPGGDEDVPPGSRRGVEEAEEDSGDSLFASFGLEPFEEDEGGRDGGERTAAEGGQGGENLPSGTAEGNAERLLAEWMESGHIPIELDLPGHFHSHSSFTCAVSRTTTSTSNPAVLLLCGHAISKSCLEKISGSSRSRIRCPMCPQNMTIAQTRTLHFSAD
uniref:RING-type domain-containing protein n=1 Tax=Chromera velia CCMP2878 TaxID=1169474 RepID=A0A0G4HUJ3_9ALVE|eukprot:Cvel_8658.t1-p1 / transcript=Cvel_8658.t1 / gene=Cvel_8658 / organism=Chromera_velia_CCMP2878 / gene_product=LisH domain-containing protein C29A3.03c, putative / transcript_product=LisH domain-containing protein C29A3.03c, putative / location=Cvel_scaffold483:5947-16864(-) / protein_length=1892 / sequence_SO=supercontig / SO=protein_coding / is_pseudo=false